MFKLVLLMVFFNFENLIVLGLTDNLMAIRFQYNLIIVEKCIRSILNVILLKELID